MTTYLGKSCSFGFPRVPFVNCRQFMYLVISLLVLRAGCGIWLYQFLIIAYLFTLFFRFRHHIHTQDFKTFLIQSQNKRFKPVSIRIKMIWICIRHFFCYSQKRKWIWRTSPNSKSWRKNDVRWCYQSKERHLKCHFSLFYHFFVTLIRIKSSHNAIYAINYCRTKVT